MQLGFVVVAVVSSTTNLADRLPPRRLIFFGATGAFLAGVCPPALKAMSTWYRQGRGMALGVLVGALTVGSALPHLVNAVGGVDWKLTLVVVSVLTFVGGVVADRLSTDGPYAVGAATFDPSQLKAIVTNRDFRLASAGYFGHMWELYAMWAWIAAFYGDAFSSDRAASLAAFAVIGVGAGGSFYTGLMSDRRSRSAAAALAMRWSASTALEVIDPRYVGTALTIQLAAGFVLTVFTIFLVPVIQDAHGWGWAFFMLAPGPILGRGRCGYFVLARRSTPSTSMSQRPSDQARSSDDAS